MSQSALSGTTVLEVRPKV